MKTKIKVVVAAALFLAFLAGTAYAEGGACPIKHDKGSHSKKFDDLTSKLGLTPEQAKLLKEAKAAHRETTAALCDEIKGKHKALKEALSAPGVTRQQVEPAANELKALQARLIDNRIDGILKIKSILTPEQYKKMNEMKGDWKKGRR